MPRRRVDLVVQDCGSCPLIAHNDLWTVSGRHVAASPGKICCWAVCSIYPKLREITRELPDEAPLPTEMLTCEVCGAAFQMTEVQSKTVILEDHSAIPKRAPQKAPATLLLKRMRKAVPFLLRLPKELATELMSNSTIQNFEDNDLILGHGCNAEFLYIIADGGVNVYQNGDTAPLGSIAAGGCFGESSLLTGNVIDVDYRARGTASIMLLPRQRLDALMSHHSQLSCELSKLLADKLAATPLVPEQGKQGGGFSGKLSIISLPDLIQALRHGRRSGTLVARSGTLDGLLTFRSGILCSAACGRMLGEEAFYRIISWTSGDFRFEAHEPPLILPGQLKIDSTRLLLEAFRRMDESKTNLGGNL